MNPEQNQPVDPKGRKPAVLTVTELNRRIKSVLKAGIGQVHVAGEISGARFPASGHVYFTLKDPESQIQAVLFRRQHQALRFKVEDGLEVVVFGEVSVYEKRGDCQIVVERMEPKGLGALQLAFEQLKEKLKREGLFDQARKRPIPFFPGRVGVVTSSSGAAVRDIINVALRRFPPASILVHPVKVQGEGAASDIAAAIAGMNRIGGMDVLIVGRGGGSLEDLWAFNEEPVARAVAASSIPVVSAVGHEIDFTICDFVADRRAATPTEAAELVFPRLDLIEDKIESLERGLDEALARAFERGRRRVETAASRLDPGRFMSAVMERLQWLDDLGERLGQAAARAVKSRRERLDALEARLRALGPKRIMERGFSVTLAHPGKSAVRSIAHAPPGTLLETVLCDGRVFSRVCGQDEPLSGREKEPGS